MAVDLAIGIGYVSVLHPQKMPSVLCHYHNLQQLMEVLCGTYTLGHRAPSYCTNYTADVTDNGRYLYKEDIARIKAMGVNAFSFAISWSRVVPFAKAGSPVSEEGLAFYEDLVKELLANDITPIATLFHWSTPLNLVFEYGGFLNETIVEDYEYYADIVFKRLGKYVKTFFTFNEPRKFSDS